MNNHQETLQNIEQLLLPLDALSIKVVNNSHLHVGHEGAKSGGGHFAVWLVSEKLKGLTKIKRHQMVYQLLNELFVNGKIHALEVNALTTEENT
ncbi:MAG: BolA family transcriptional regulator [Proteobacteria bacterium]|nr:BolA family transcriptional regulator [Pseudomonadota bacterium]